MLFLELLLSCLGCGLGRILDHDEQRLVVRRLVAVLVHKGFLEGPCLQDFDDVWRQRDLGDNHILHEVGAELEHDHLRQQAIDEAEAIIPQRRSELLESQRVLRQLLAHRVGNGVSNGIGFNELECGHDSGNVVSLVIGAGLEKNPCLQSFIVWMPGVENLPRISQFGLQQQSCF